MNLKRKILIPLLGALVLVLALAFASACAKHVHTYSEAWESNDTYHWHAPTCDDTEEVLDRATHIYEDGICTVCGHPQPESAKKVYDMSAVKFEDSTIPYDGEPHSIQIGGTLPTGVSVSYEGNGKIDAGTYAVTAHFTGDSKNYQSIPDKTATLTIEQATVEGIAFEGETVSYNGEAHSIFIKGDLPEGVSVSYEGNGMTNVGQYTVTAKFQTDKNHKPIADMVATLTINKATFDMTKVKFEDDTVVYDGNAHSITVSNLPTGVQATYDGNGKVNAGTYTITVHFIVDTTNYNTIADRTAKLTIEKATYDMNDITFNGLTVVYDGNTHPLAIKGNLPDGVHVTYDNNDQTTVGHHVVVAHFTGDTQNHNPISDKQAILIIQQATVAGITFEDETVTYNGEAHSIFIKGDLPDGVNVTYENNGQINAGEYQVKAIFDTGENYKPIAVMTAKLVIEKADYDMKGITFEGLTVTYDGNTHPLAIQGQLPKNVSVSYENNDQTTAGQHEVIAHFTGDTQNHNPISDKTATLVIEQATVEGITFEGLKITYDGNAHPLKITGDLPEEVSVRYENNDQVNAGEYQVKAIFDTGKNYKPLSDMVATLIIEKATYDMKNIAFEGKTITYDGNTHPLAIQGQLPKDVDVSYENNDQTAAGQHEVIAHFTGDKANYNEIDDMKATLTIEKRELVIVFEGDTEIYYDGKEHKEITAKPQNLCEGDTVEIELTYSGDMIAIGKYTVTATIKPNPNYQLTTNNTITVSIIERLYKIIFRQEGQIDKIVFVKEGEGLTRKQFPALVEVEGYYFEWEDVDLTTVTDDVIVHATKLVITYIIDYHTEEDVENGNPSTYDVETSVELKDPLRNGYRFLGWFTEETYDNQVTEIAVGSTGNRNLYAKWELIIYKIIYHLPNGSGYTNGNPSTYDVTRSNVSLSAPYCYDGYNFCGWFLDEGYTESISVITLEVCAEHGEELHLYARIVFSTQGLQFEKNSSNGYRVTRYTGSASSVIIPALWNSLPVIEIASAAFQERTITDITIPESIISIGNDAFKDCTGLTTVYWNATNCTKAGSYHYLIFSGCTALTTVYIGEKVESIPNYAFKDCTGLETVYLNAMNCKTAGSYDYPIFSGCTALTTVYIGEKVESIPAYAFKGFTGLESITIPENVTSIGAYAFKGCTGLTSITIPENVTSIGKSAFEDCTSLESITIPESITSIGGSAFYYCTSLTTVYWNATNCTTAGSSSYPIFKGCTALTTVHIGENVENIPAYTFYGCTGLETVYWNATNCTTAGSIFDPIFNGCVAFTTVYIGENVESIPACTFYRCTNLASVNFGDNSSLTAIGYRAFDYCTGLESVYITDIKAWCKIDFGDGSANPLHCGATLYLNDNPVADLKEFSDITEIKQYAFYGYKNFVTLMIPKGVTSIGEDAFGGCASLISVTIPESVTSIGTWAFYKCTSLETVYWNATNCTKAGSYNHPIFDDCTALTTVHIGENVESISGAFSGCTSLTTVDFGNNSSLTTIGEWAFYHCTSLASITIPESVTSIGEDAFWYCEGLISVTIPESITSIGGSAFYDCTSLESVHITDIKAWCKIDFGNGSANPLYYGATLYLNDDPVADLKEFSDITEIKQYAFYGYKDFVTLTIPNGVTSIGEDAFAYCENLASVTIPESVTSIGDHAFEDCTSLESITIPESVTSIGYGAFSGCTSLTTVDFGNNSSLTSIGGRAFSGCTSLESIAIPENVKSIGGYAFEDCTNLESVIIPKSVTSIDIGAFYKCTSLGTVYWNAINCATAGSDDYPIFKGCAAFTTVYIGENVESINYAFKGCTSLATVYWNAINCATVRIFSGRTALTTVHIGENVESIPDDAFYGCTSLATVYWNATNCTKVGGSYIGKDYTIFRSCTAFTTVYIGENVESIPAYAFYSCTGIESVHITNLKAWCEIDFDDYDANPLHCGATLYLNDDPVTDLNNLTDITTIKRYAFYGCTSLASITIPDSVTSIGYKAFYNCTSLESITIPESVTSIGTSAFSGCKSLETVYWNAGSCTTASSYEYPIFKGCAAFTTVYIGENVESIPAYAFYGCTSLASVDFGDNSSLSSIGKSAFSGCTSLATVDFGDNSSLTSIGEGAFSGCTSLATVYWNATNCATAGSSFYPIFNGCTALTTVHIGENVESIPAYAFYGCSNLESINFGGYSSLTSIGYEAFYNCTSLESITIPENVASIGYEAFYNCTSLESINFGGNSSLTSIGGRAFRQCTSLESITIPENVTSIGDAFYNCTSLATVYWNATNCATAGGSRYSPIFSGCTALTTVYIGENVKSIPAYAFYKCTSLESIIIPASVTSIGEWAFEYCTSLKNVYYGGTTTQWNRISISAYSDILKNAVRYYYSAEAPDDAKWAKSNNWWHYDPDTGEVVIWKKES